MKIAICYDFDKTLSTTDMQNFKLIPDFHLTADEFWKECAEFSKEQNCENILTCLYMTLKKCKENGIVPTKEYFNSCGKDIEYFKGVDTWFENINKFGKSLGVEIEHYIISSGLKEIVEGSNIAKYVEKIYACSYCYDENGVAIWPALNVNYTNKTQFLFRINKGIFDPTDSSVNDHMSHDIRRIPFENMIYIGDSETDIPSMKLIRSKKGFAISVYDNDVQPSYYTDLINYDRVDYCAKADYSIDGELYNIIKEIIESIYHSNILKEINTNQKAKK